MDTAQKLKGTEFKINDEGICSLLLAGLPGKFVPMIKAREHSKMITSADATELKIMDMRTESEITRSEVDLLVKEPTN